MTTEAPASSPSLLLMPDTYAGESDFDSWERHFSACAAANGWTDDRKLLVLPTRLRGRAQRMYDHLASGEKETYRKLCEALSSKCSPAAVRILAAANFRSRTHHSGEHLDTYAYDLCDIFDKAYPGSPTETRDSMIRDQFVLGLERALRDKVTSANPATLADALQAAARVTAIRELPGASPTVALTHQAAASASATYCSDQTTTDAITALASAVAELTRKVDGLDMDSGRSNPRQHRQDRPTCFQCGSTGHFARSCPRRQQGRSTTRFPSRRGPEN